MQTVLGIEEKFVLNISTQVATYVVTLCHFWHCFSFYLQNSFLGGIVSTFFYQIKHQAGHAAQNVHLQAEVLGLGSVAVGAFDDASVSKVLSLPAYLEPLYMVTVGYYRS
jgi:hypothetical protein